MAAPIDNPFSFPVTHFGQFMDHWSHNHEHRALQYLDNANLFVAGMTGLAAILAVGDFSRRTSDSPCQRNGTRTFDNC